jgi:hypothetical protein
MSMIKTQMNNLRKEEVEQIDELSKETLKSYKDKAVQNASDQLSRVAGAKQRAADASKLKSRVGDKLAKTNIRIADKAQSTVNKRVAGMISATKKMKEDTDIKEKINSLITTAEYINEGSAQDKLYQQHQAIRTANKRPNPEYYKELGMSYDIKDDKERITKQSEIKKKYKVEGAQLDQLKTMRDDPKWQENPEHKAQLDKRFKMAKDRADLDRGEVTDSSGKTVPVLTPDKFKEKNPNFMKEEGDYPHQGVGVSRSMQMAADMARQKARTSMMQSKYGNEFQDKAIPDYDEDKMDLKPGTSPGTYQATVRMRERLKQQESFSSLRSKIAEAKKMKGEDPCWDDYKMIGTKMKNGKEVPNCVPKESVTEGKEEQEYDYEGDMAMSDLRSILHNAKTVHDMLEPNTNIPEWCQSKITLAEDYISTVANYMRGEMTEEAILEASKPGLYANIHAKRKRIAKGSGERMRKPGTKGAPTAQAFKDSAKTAKK